MFRNIGKMVFFLTACFAALILSVAAAKAASTSHNTKLGKGALASKPTGTDNTAIGFNALHFDTSGSANTAVGSGALQNNIGGTDGLDGNFNTAVGSDALSLNTTGFSNTASGASALSKNTDGVGNTATGAGALVNNSTGESNTASGWGALLNNTTGSGNTAIGSAALGSNATGCCNTAIGIAADVSAGNLFNATAIGANAIVNASNKIRLGNGAVTVIEGQVAFTASSDKTKKENFQPIDGEEVLRKLRGFSLTSWNFIGHDPEKFRHYGPMAQDFFAAFGHDGVGTIGTPTTINSGDLAGILMSAVQALEKRTEELKEKNARIVALEKEASELKAKQSFFETIAARFEALELKLNHPVQVRTQTTLGEERSELRP